MFKERILIFFLAILGGVIFSIGLFYLYQKTKSIEAPTQGIQPSSQPSPIAFFLNIDQPQDEQVFDKKIVSLEGKTSPQAKVLVSMEDKELVLTPSADGSFSVNITLVDGVNLIEVVSVNPSGKILSEKRTFTFTSESF